LINNNYYVETNGAKVEIVNSLLNEEVNDLPAKTSERQGQLHLVISKEIIKKGLLKNTKSIEQSVLLFTDLAIASDNATITLDGFVKITNPQNISVLPRGLRAIVGRQRSF
jgi:hypothetical protein